MNYLLVGLSIVLLFLAGQFVLSRRTRQLQQVRAGVTFADFSAAGSMDEVPEEVQRAVFETLRRDLGFAPFPDDELDKDYGLVGGDLDDLLVEVLRQLGVEVTHRGTRETNIRTVREVAVFIESYRSKTA